MEFDIRLRLHHVWQERQKVTRAMIVEVIRLVLAALATGGLMVNWIGLARAMAKLSASTYIEFHQITNQTFDPYMPIVVVGSILGGLVQALLFSLQTLSGRLSLAGAACFVAALIIALATNVPINKRVATWSIEQPPSNWAVERDRWIRFHVLRTLLSVPGLLFYSAALALQNNR